MTAIVQLDRTFLEEPAIASVTAGDGTMDVRFIDGSFVHIERDVAATPLRVYQSFHPKHPMRNAEGWETCKSQDWVTDRLAGWAKLAMTTFAAIRP